VLNVTDAITTATSWRPIDVRGFIARIGPLLAARAGNGWSYAIRSDTGHTNSTGTVHGGVIATLVDHAVALVAWEEAGRRPVVTIQLETRFVDAAWPGEQLEASVRLRHRSGSLLYLDADVMVADRLVATASAILKVSAENTQGKP
jgi:uncharacterized protein (TIGR00369 family)